MEPSADVGPTLHFTVMSAALVTVAVNFWVLQVRRSAGLGETVTVTAPPDDELVVVLPEVVDPLELEVMPPPEPVEVVLPPLLHAAAREETRTTRTDE
jgi:hypothetical protein